MGARLMLATLKGDEIFQILGTVGSTGVPSGTTETTTAQSVAALSGGGAVRTIQTGTSDTASATDTWIAWNSASAAPKTQTIPAGTFNGQTFSVKDARGTAATFNMTITPASGTIDGQASYVMTLAFQSISLKWDGASNFIVV